MAAAAFPGGLSSLHAPTRGVPGPESDRTLEGLESGPDLKSRRAPCSGTDTTVLVGLKWIGFRVRPARGCYGRLVSLAAARGAKAAMTLSSRRNRSS